MSYTKKIREEIRESTPKNACCGRSMLYGMLYSKGNLTCDGILLRLDAMEADFFQTLYHALYRNTKEISRVGASRFLIKRPQLIAYFTEAKDKGTYFDIKCENCKAYFLRGVFLASGRLSDPNQSFRLEFSLGERAEEMLPFFLHMYRLPMQIYKRKNETILYTRKSEVVEDFFTSALFFDNSFAVMNLKIVKDYRNAANRQTNCEANNIAKTIEVAQKQVALIQKLIEKKCFSRLPEEVQQAAKLRLENPEISLSVLGTLLLPPVSKSGVNHRLKKMEMYAKQWFEEEK